MKPVAVAALLVIAAYPAVPQHANAAPSWDLVATLRPAASLTPVKPPPKCRKGHYACKGRCIPDRFLCLLN
jgi:hypothetical protein